MIAISSADARIGGGGSSGSRGSRTFSAPPITIDRADAARPFDRTMTQPGSPGMAAAAAAGAKGGFFNRPGMGMLGGLAAGFLGAGLLGMLFGGGLFGGLGGLSSIIGLLLADRPDRRSWCGFAMSWWQRRNAPAAPMPALAGLRRAPPPASASSRSGCGFGFGVGRAAAGDHAGRL